MKVPTKKPFFNELALDIIKSVVKSVSGHLIRTEDITGNVSYSVENEGLFVSADNRESSKWDVAVSELMNAGCLELVGIKGSKIYKVTVSRYEVTALDKYKDL